MVMKFSVIFNETRADVNWFFRFDFDDNRLRLNIDDRKFLFLFKIQDAVIV